MFELPVDSKHRDRVKWLLSKWEVAPPTSKEIKRAVNQEKDGGQGNEGGSQEEFLGEVGSGIELIAVKGRAEKEMVLEGGQKRDQDGVLVEAGSGIDPTSQGDKGVQETVIGEERGDQCAEGKKGNTARMAAERDHEGRGEKGDERRKKR